MASKKTNARSSVSGKYVTKRYAAGHKKTTEIERVKPVKKGGR